MLYITVSWACINTNITATSAGCFAKQNHQTCSPPADCQSPQALDFLREQQAVWFLNQRQTLSVHVLVLVDIYVCGNRLVLKCASHLSVHVFVVGEGQHHIQWPHLR